MSVAHFTIIAAVLATLAAVSWLVAAWIQRRWRMFCLLAAVIYGYFAVIYCLIWIGYIDSLTAGQQYLRPAVGGLMIFGVAFALRFWRRA